MCAVLRNSRLLCVRNSTERSADGSAFAVSRAKETAVTVQLATRHEADDTGLVWPKTRGVRGSDPPFPSISTVASSLDIHGAEHPRIGVCRRTRLLLACT